MIEDKPPTTPFSGLGAPSNHGFVVVDGLTCSLFQSWFRSKHPRLPVWSKQGLSYPLRSHSLIHLRVEQYFDCESKIERMAKRSSPGGLGGPRWRDTPIPAEESLSSFLLSSAADVLVSVDGRRQILDPRAHPCPRRGSRSPPPWPRPRQGSSAPFVTLETVRPIRPRGGPPFPPPISSSVRGFFSTLGEAIQPRRSVRLHIDVSIGSAAHARCAAMDAFWARHEPPPGVAGDVEVLPCVLQPERTPKRPGEVSLVENGAQHERRGRDPETMHGEEGVAMEAAC